MNNLPINKNAVRTYYVKYDATKTETLGFIHYGKKEDAEKWNKEKFNGTLVEVKESTYFNLQKRNLEK